jgi:hypothetical protein
MGQQPELDSLEERPPAWIGGSSLAGIWRLELLGFREAEREEAVNRLRGSSGKEGRGAFGICVWRQGDGFGARTPWGEGFGAQLPQEGTDLARGKSSARGNIGEGGAREQPIRLARENAWPGGTYVDCASIAGAIPASFLSIGSRHVSR